MFSREEIALEFVDAQELVIAAARETRFSRACWVDTIRRERARVYNVGWRRKKRAALMAARASVLCANPLCGVQFERTGRSDRLYCTRACMRRWFWTRRTPAQKQKQREYDRLYKATPAQKERQRKYGRLYKLAHLREDAERRRRLRARREAK